MEREDGSTDTRRLFQLQNTHDVCPIGLRTTRAHHPVLSELNPNLTSWFKSVLQAVRTALYTRRVPDTRRRVERLEHFSYLLVRKPGRYEYPMVKGPRRTARQGLMDWNSRFGHSKSFSWLSAARPRMKESGDGTRSGACIEQQLVGKPKQFARLVAGTRGGEHDLGHVRTQPSASSPSRSRQWGHQKHATSTRSDTNAGPASS